jgi:integrase
MRAGRSARQLRRRARAATDVSRRRGDYGYLNLANWRRREWYPALESADLPRHEIYVLRHTFATWALTRPPELEIFELARYMGDSVRTIERYYGHLAKGATDRARVKFNARANRSTRSRNHTSRKAPG